MTEDSDAVRDWWRTSIIDMEPGRIAFRGHPIQDLIGTITFPQMIWLMTRGELPSAGQSALLEAALVAAVDHGPQAPSISATRMAITCGIGLQSAMATGVNMLGDVHGGAGEQAAELYEAIAHLMDSGEALEDAVQRSLDDWRATHGRIVSGFGHRFHKPVDPRSAPLMARVRMAAVDGVVTGRYADIAEQVQANLSHRKPLAMNIDGATAVVFCELGFPPPLSRGLFVLSRSVGLLAHAWEQKQQGGRNKGPMPPSYIPRYDVDR